MSGDATDPTSVTFYVCVNERFGSRPSCKPRGSPAVAEALERLGGDRVSVVRQTCMGFCSRGPTVKRSPGGILLEVSVDQVPDILAGAVGPDPNAQTDAQRTQWDRER